MRFGVIGSTLMMLAVGLVALFVFFAVLGAFSPAETVAATIVAVVAAVVFAIHMYRVRHALTDQGGTELHRSLNTLRERRGF